MPRCLLPRLEPTGQGAMPAPLLKCQLRSQPACLPCPVRSCAPDDTNFGAANPGSRCCSNTATLFGGVYLCGSCAPARSALWWPGNAGTRRGGLPCTTPAAMPTRRLLPPPPAGALPTAPPAPPTPGAPTAAALRPLCRTRPRSGTARAPPTRPAWAPTRPAPGAVLPPPRRPCPPPSTRAATFAQRAPRTPPSAPTPPRAARAAAPLSWRATSAWRASAAAPPTAQTWALQTQAPPAATCGASCIWGEAGLRSTWLALLGGHRRLADVQAQAVAPTQPARCPPHLRTRSGPLCGVTPTCVARKAKGGTTGRQLAGCAGPLATQQLKPPARPAPTCFAATCPTGLQVRRGQRALPRQRLHPVLRQDWREGQCRRQLLRLPGRPHQCRPHQHRHLLQPAHLLQELVGLWQVSPGRAQLLHTAAEP